MRLPVLTCVAMLALESVAAEWFVSPAGAPANAGTRAAPWDIASALDANKNVAAGDTLWILEGTYKRRPKEQFDVRLTGNADKPVHVRGEAGKRVTIDGGLAVQDPSAHLWIHDLEIMVSEPQPEKPTSPGSHPADFTRPWGGLNVFGGKHCKFINLVIHDCRQGVSWWKGSIDSDLYGCVIYENGWQGVDRGHGHCIYAQNKDGVKRISNCILTAKLEGQLTLQAYGSKNADVDNFLCEDNVAFGTGRFLIGGGKPSHNIRVYRNHLYKVDMQLGYNAPENEDCDVSHNRIFRGSLNIVKYKSVKQEKNWIWKQAEQPKQTESFLLPNAYDPSRAHLIVYNWTGEKTAALPVAEFMKEGDAYSVWDPKNLYGAPLHEGKVAGTHARIPTPHEFNVYVLRKR